MCVYFFFMQAENVYKVGCHCNLILFYPQITYLRYVINLAIGHALFFLFYENRGHHCTRDLKKQKQSG